MQYSSQPVLKYGLHKFDTRDDEILWKHVPDY